MIENHLIHFNTQIWGYDFACTCCGFKDSTEGEAPISAMDAMKEKGWIFRIDGENFIPVCPGCTVSSSEFTEIQQIENNDGVQK